MSGKEIAESSDSDKEGKTDGSSKEGGICDNGVTLGGVLQYIKEYATDEEIKKLLDAIAEFRSGIFKKEVENKILEKLKRGKSKRKREDKKNYG